jgi:predicted DNA-binding transcriptional regulator AlpA
MVSMSTQTPANDPTQLQSLDILSPRTVEAKLGLDATTIWRMRRRREFSGADQPFPWPQRVSAP